MGFRFGGNARDHAGSASAGKNDFDTLRWSVRSDGKSGFVFVNNYERLQDMPPKKDVQFAINLPSGPLIFPQSP